MDFNQIWEKKDIIIIILIPITIFIINSVYTIGYDINLDTTSINILIPFTLLSILYFVIKSIITTKTKGTILIDYFRICKLDVIFALIFGYIMFAFLALTIIFAYNRIYIKTKQCNPLMLYLGSSRSCNYTNFESFENIQTVDETFIEKFDFLWKIAKKQFLQLYSNYLAVLQFISNSIRFIILTINSLAIQYFINQDEILNKIWSIMIRPFYIQFTEQLYKIIHLTVN